MRFGGANDHPNPDSPEYYAPRSERMADPRSNVAPQTNSGHLPHDSPSSRFDEMREEAFAKFARPLESSSSTNAVQHADCSPLRAPLP